MKDVIAKAIKKALKEEEIDMTEKQIMPLIEIPPSHEMGDFAFPCFILASKLKEIPATIAINLRKKMGNPPEGITDIQTNGPYINFFINRKSHALQVIDRILKEREQYGQPSTRQKVTTMVEFPSPNTNKPLHLGHLRNMAIGESVSRILEFSGEKVIRANLNNDRGIHICKSMAAYHKYGKNKTPKSEDKKSDHFVGDYYVMFNTRAKKNEQLDILAHRILQKWEAGDKEVLALWKKMNKWALDGFEETYQKVGIKHDVTFFESEIYTQGKDIILKAVKDKIFQQRKDGAVIADLKKEGLGEKVLLRIDGTSVYITQDLYLAILKFQKYKLNKSIYVVGNEQNHHFKVLDALLKKIGFKQNITHLSYGMVNLPEGKMKSREGTVVDADDLIDKLQKMVKKSLTSRAKLSKKELDRRSLIIALSAIKYMLLRVDTKKNMTFNPKESVSFEGDTGPYLLYSYARASSIINKYKKLVKKTYFEEMEKQEIGLMKKLGEFPGVVSKAYTTMNPSLISNYCSQLSQTFNEFYHTCPVKGAEDGKGHFRMQLVDSFRTVLKNGLNLIGIETLEEM